MQETNIDKAFEILDEFKSLPNSYPEPTFLELSRYPRRRFEEISSRLLSFYFNPTKEHNLKDLFLSSLFELLKRNEIQFRNDQINVITEDNADGKRIDLVIYSPDFIVGIENKITAPLYNPLAVYKKRLEEYSIENTIKIVLSLNSITKKKEKELMKNNAFISVTYSDFFETIKRNIGEYISTCNQKYLTHLFDFIQTIENMKTLNKIDKRLVDFFYDNSKNIEELVKSYNLYKEYILNQQKERITEIKETISKNTGVNWWAWQGWDLGYNSFNKTKPRIGIESSFKETKNNPLGEFHIYITTWNLKDWKPYEKELVEKFPNNFLDKINNRVYLHMDILDGDNENLIVEKLKEYYDIVSEITK